MHLPRNQLSAVLQRSSYCVFQPAAARHLHAHDGDALNIVSAQDFGQFFTVIHRVELGTADKRDAVPDEIPMEIRIGVGRAVGRDEQVCTVEIRRVHGHELNLHRPLAQLRDRGSKGCRGGSARRKRLCTAARTAGMR